METAHVGNISITIEGTFRWSDLGQGFSSCVLWKPKVLWETPLFSRFTANFLPLKLCLSNNNFIFVWFLTNQFFSLKMFKSLKHFKAGSSQICSLEDSSQLFHPFLMDFVVEEEKMEETLQSRIRFQIDTEYILTSHKIPWITWSNWIIKTTELYSDPWLLWVQGCCENHWLNW